MGRIVVNTHLTLDGVMQAPGQVDEDTRGGFEHGGWQRPYGDQVMGRIIGERMAGASGLLLGRRTYENFAAFWPTQTDENPFSAAMNGMRKFVASKTLKAPLAWANSTLLEGDLGDSVGALKRQVDGDLAVVGSGDLVRSLMRRGLVDEYVLLIHPLVLGQGLRLFDGHVPATTLALVETTTTTTGVIIATYRLA